MSIWSLLGFDPKKLAAPAASASAKAETETVRKIVAQLDSAEPEHARYIAAFAYLLTRVAHADHHISKQEAATIERVIMERGSERVGFSEAQAVLVAEIARVQTTLFAGTENYLVGREFDRLASLEQKLLLIDCLYAVCGADHSISVVEDNEIGRIATELHVDHRDLVNVRLRHRDRLAVLQK